MDGNCPRIITRTYQATDSLRQHGDVLRRSSRSTTASPRRSLVRRIDGGLCDGCPGTGYHAVTATDNCGIPVVTWMGDVWSGNCPRIITRTYQAADACGNTATCTQIITVNDSIAAADHLPGGGDGGMYDGCSGPGYHAGDGHG